MICEFKVNGELKKFRISLLSNYKNDGLKMDYQLTCINEDYCSEYDQMIIPHNKFKESWRENKIKVTL